MQLLLTYIWNHQPNKYSNTRRRRISLAEQSKRL